MDEPRNNADPAQRGYEPSDISTRRLFAFAAGVVALVVLGVLLSAAVFHFFVRHESLGPPASPFENVRQLPPSPRLQTTAPFDLGRYHDSQNEILGSYGWVDPQAGFVRIPIERAMKLVLERGLPIRGSSQVKGQASTPGRAAPPGKLPTAPTPRDGEQTR